MNLSTTAKVRYVSTTTIPPSSIHNDSLGRIELTPWDVDFLPAQTIQRGLLYMKPKPKQEEGEEQQQQQQILINRLKSSLSEVLNRFYPLAGRLSTTLHEDNGTTSVYIDCNSAGAEFIHATAHEITLSHFLNPMYVPKLVDSFFPHYGAINYDGRSTPLISVQVTELIDGIFIGFSVNHCVCDGTSFWHFINSWSEITCRNPEDVQNHNQISRPPIFKRSLFFDESDFPIRLPFNNDEKFRETHIGDQPPLLEVRFFHFSPENIAKLKSKAKSEIGPDSNQQISSFQALMTHVWLAVTRARRLDSNEETSYKLLMGNRARMNPPLPEEYFGNSFMSGVARVKVGELLEKGLGFGASLLNQVVKSHNDKSIRKSWKSRVDKPVMMFSNALVSNALIAVSSPRFNVYGNDFGWGRPIAVRTRCSRKYDGKITVNPGPVQGSIDIEACLFLETLEAMRDDAEFMKVVTILPPFKTSV